MTDLVFDSFIQEHNCKILDLSITGSIDLSGLDETERHILFIEVYEFDARDICRAPLLVEVVFILFLSFFLKLVTAKGWDRITESLSQLSFW